MKKKVDVSVSTDPINSIQEIIEYARFMQDKADMLHCDIMDGKFVEKQNFDEELVKNINDSSLIMLDVHLMVDEPKDLVKKYVEAGANIITVHYEAFKNKSDIIGTLNFIKSKKCLCGLSFKPKTQIQEIKNFLYGTDIVLVMSVEPGASGQKLQTDVYKKLSQLNEFRTENRLNFKIEVDGGVNDQNCKLLAEFGADILVSGSFVYNSSDKNNAIKKLKCQK